MKKRGVKGSSSDSSSDDNKDDNGGGVGGALDDHEREKLGRLERKCKSLTTQLDRALFKNENLKERVEKLEVRGQFFWSNFVTPFSFTYSGFMM